MKIRKKVITASLTAVILLGSLSTTILMTQVEAATSTSKVVWGVNLRTNPSSSSSIIRMLEIDERVSILAKSGSFWLKIMDSKGEIGYISSSSKYTVEVSGDTSNDNITESSKVEKVISAGMKYMGTPYEFGSSRSNTDTFDCSDFIRQIYLDGLGLKLPADSSAQGSYVKDNGTVQNDWTKLKRGDLMFFMSYKGSSASAYSNVNKSTAKITHDGIYLGNGQVLHTYSKESGGVKISKIDGTHWEKRFLFGGSAL
jgi:cell wall-associated NlpC family hydrolase